MQRDACEGVRFSSWSVLWLRGKHLLTRRFPLFGRPSRINPLLASFVRSRFPKSSKDRVPTIKNEGKTPFEAFLDPEVKAEEESSEEEGTWA